ncbi:hypothetical protein JCM33374_g4360 [Metschnikowia sp. JCM 33374]|nr:hypothetical protein JCM33374_g4360 [Metschnikowia sp. JCM 33374]
MHIITVQESFLEVISEVESGKIDQEPIWVARRDTKHEESSELYSIVVSIKHGHLALTMGESSPHHIEMVRNNSYKFTMTIEDTNGRHVYSLFFPKSKLHLGLRSSKISTCAISPNGSRLLVGTDSGSILQYDTATEKLLGKIDDAHLADVAHLTVLPSSQVMMSVGTDLQTKLWPLGPTPVSSPARVFAEQKDQISDLAIIDRGRNFLTASREGSVLLWECSTGQVVSTFRRIDNFNDPVTCMALAEGEPVSAENTVGGDLLFGCSNKLLYVGYKSGIVQQYSVAGHYQTGIRFQRPSEVSLLLVESAYLLAGYSDGLLRIYDISGSSQKTGTKQGQDTAASYWDLQLNPNFPIECATVHKRENSETGLLLVVSNGPELLLRVDFDGTNFQTSQLIGLSEMFRIVSMGSNGDKTFVATENEIVQY